jgi:uncharacterized membrane protein
MKTTLLLALSALALCEAATPKPSLSVTRRAVESPSLRADRSALAKPAKKTGFLSAMAPAGVDVSLLSYFAFWYLGNYYCAPRARRRDALVCPPACPPASHPALPPYSSPTRLSPARRVADTLSNKRALVAAGGKAGFPMTISTLQLGVGVLYALFAWAAPDMRATPSVTLDDVLSMIPVGFCAAAAHSFSVFAQSAGAVSFAMIVKAAEPAFAAVVGTLLYGKQISQAKWLCLIPVIGGVCLASVKELDFAWYATPKSN